jgi:hypothetical protein
LHAAITLAVQVTLRPASKQIDFVSLKLNHSFVGGLILGNEIWSRDE